MQMQSVKQEKFSLESKESNVLSVAAGVRALELERKRIMASRLK